MVISAGQQIAEQANANNNKQVFGSIFVNVMAFGAKGDGGSDDTAAVAKAYASLTNGGKLFFPEGSYKFNLLIDRSNICIEGVGRSNDGLGGTSFIPADVTKPVIQIGDGTTEVFKTTLKSFSLIGERDTSTSDGIVINGATYVNVIDVDHEDFGGDGVRLTSSATQPTSFVFFSNCGFKYSRGNSFKIQYGSSFTTAVYLNDCYLQGYTNAGNRALWVDNTVNLYIANTWIQCSSSLIGNVYLNGSSSKLICSNVTMDSNSNSDVLVEVNATFGLVATYLHGSVTIDGKVKFTDGITVASFQGSLNLNTNLNYPQIVNQILFGDISAVDGSNQVPDFSGPRIYRTGTTLFARDGSFKVMGTYLQPVKFTNGSLWKNAATGQPYYSPTTETPSSDTSGFPLSQFVGVPASAIATGSAGNWSADATWLYICHASNTWKRVGIATW